MQPWIYIAFMLWSSWPDEVTSIYSMSCPGDSELSFDPPWKAYEFQGDSHLMICSYNSTLSDPSVVMEGDLVVRNEVIGSEIVRKRVDPLLGATISFHVTNIQSSSSFSCALVVSGRVRCRRTAEVVVLVNSAVMCATNKDCWGYGRNHICDTQDTQRCACAEKTAKARESPICVEMVVEDKCNQISCSEDDDDCVCMRNDAIVLRSTKYSDYIPDYPSDEAFDVIAVHSFNTSDQSKYLPWKRDECLRCLRISDGLQNLQIGLFLVGLILAFTAVTLMAIVIRKMWLYYRIPPDLLEASRDLERETIEREAELMAQRDKPPSYVEVVEYDLRISGYPPPDYEELSTAIRHISNQRRNHQRPPSNRRDRRTPSQQRTTPERRFILNPWHRCARSYMAPNPAANETAVARATTTARLPAYEEPSGQQRF